MYHNKNGAPNKGSLQDHEVPRISWNLDEFLFTFRARNTNAGIWMDFFESWNHQTDRFDGLNVFHHVFRYQLPGTKAQKDDNMQS